MTFRHIHKLQTRAGLAAVAVLAAWPSASASQVDGWPQTRPERTDYRETSSYNDVFGFLMALRDKGAPLEVRIMGTLPSGRRMPLVVATRVPSANSTDRCRLRQQGIPVVYLQANIHGGEVEGKEAVQMLLRHLTRDDKDRLLERVVLLVDPIYNIDGNEKLGPGPQNRASQDGPDPVGVRANAEGLDLNRDALKAEAPETRAILEHVYTRWDPDVVMDLHTTNGTRHGFHLTYAPPLNPNTPLAIQSFCRGDLLPAVRRRMLERHGLKTFDYGNLQSPEGIAGEPPGWVTFGQEPRYVTNYLGLRNRIAILSEAASFRPFRERVSTTLRFVEETLSEVDRQRVRITRLTADADALVVEHGRKPQSTPALGVRFALASKGTEVFPLEKRTPGVPVDRRKAPTELEDVRLRVFDRFEATRSASFPAAYLIPEAQAAVARLLKRHGIIVERLSQAWRGDAQAFRINQVVSPDTPVQARKVFRLEGAYEKTGAELAAGDFVVRTSQPLGILAFQILEPESLDGAASWGFVEGLSAPSTYPILKVLKPAEFKFEIPAKQ